MYIVFACLTHCQLMQSFTECKTVYNTPLIHSNITAINWKCVMIKKERKTFSVLTGRKGRCKERWRKKRREKGGKARRWVFIHLHFMRWCSFKGNCNSLYIFKRDSFRKYDWCFHLESWRHSHLKGWMKKHNGPLPKVLY